MKTDEIVKLTRGGLVELLRARGEIAEPLPLHERRRATRWPFPGAVEIRPEGEDGVQPMFGACRNLSETGMGMSCDAYFEPESRLDISLHLPEVSFYGKAVVRYCMQTPHGYMTGVEFDFRA